MKRNIKLFVLISGAGFMSLLSATAQSLATPLLHYKFYDGLSAPAIRTAADTGTPPAANGTLNGNTGWTTNTPSGTGVAFSTAGGANDYMSAGTVDKVSGLTAFTVTLWVNLQANPANADRLFSTRGIGTDPLTGGNTGIDLFMSSVTSTATNISADAFRLTLAINGVATNSSVSMGANNSWAFVAVTFDGTSNSQNVSFLTGTNAEDGTASQLGALLSLTPNSVIGGNDLRIGGTAATDADRSPNAFIDDFRLYDGVLSLDDIRAIQGQNIPEPALTAALIALPILFLALRRRKRASN